MVNIQQIQETWPHVAWIRSTAHGEKALPSWMQAFKRSSLNPQDLREIPIPLQVENCKVSSTQQERAGMSSAAQRMLKIATYRGEDKLVGKLFYSLLFTCLPPRFF